MFSIKEKRQAKKLQKEVCKRVLVTGGTRGIGKAISEKFLQNGFSVIYTGTKNDETYSGNPDLTFVPADFSDDNGIEAFIKRLGTLPPIDICINNAGINRINMLENIAENDYDDVFRINVKAPFMISQFLSKQMRKNNFGRIVNISSIWGEITKAGRTVYTGTKSAILGITRTMAVEMAQYNVIINAVSPGFTLTDLTKRSLSETEMDALTRQIPINRLAETKEIAELVYFLSSKENTYIVGQNIIIDGGYSIV